MFSVFPDVPMCLLGASSKAVFCVLNIAATMFFIGIIVKHCPIKDIERMCALSFLVWLFFLRALLCIPLQLEHIDGQATSNVVVDTIDRSRGGGFPIAA